MVELKTSIYDDNNPPFAEATAAPESPTHSTAMGGIIESNVVVVDATVDNVNHETDPLMMQPPSTNDNPAASNPDSSDDPIPNVLTEEEEQERSRKTGAGIASGVIGFCLGGPLLALIFGFGATYAYDKGGVAGDTAQAVGDLALTVKDKAREINNKHNVVEKTKVAASQAWGKAKEKDREHHILDKTKSALRASWFTFTTFVKEHQLIERGIDGISKFVHWASDRLSERMNEEVNNKKTNDNKK